MSTLHRFFIFIQLHGPHLTGLPAFFLYAQYHNFWLQHLKAVWNLCLNADSERPTLISHKALTEFFFLNSFRWIQLFRTHFEVHRYRLSNDYKQKQSFVVTISGTIVNTVNLLRIILISFQIYGHIVR